MFYPLFSPAPLLCLNSGISQSIIGFLLHIHARAPLLCLYSGISQSIIRFLLHIHARSPLLCLYSGISQSFIKMAEENFNEHDVDGTPENSYPPEAQESENDSGGGGEKKWPGENVFRMLVPVQKVGRILGCKGECITKICKETKARIRIIDGPPGTTEAAVLRNFKATSITKNTLNGQQYQEALRLYLVMVSAKEEPDIPIPPALECLLRLHKHVIDGDSDPVVYTRLLVVTTRAAYLIGKQGATIKSIEDASSCTISISGEVFALPDNRVVEILREAHRCT
ncbi:hypothetical protein F0562_021173 [Nyssa sinensis]|uniref:K Homology domain-containing protein n=1 Tax=Nyssa sinensis TaxID=561372 RepID=A0A5J5BNR3_9ASTE|nr:hypothetical protein F0562_021173 [Nyssa sinensis]